VIAEEREIAARATIFSEGDVGDALYLIRYGTVAIFRKDSSTGADEEITSLGSGSHFGEMALVNEDHRRKASIRAKENTFLMAFSRERLERLATEHPEVGLEIYRALAEALAKRLSAATGHAAHFKAMALHHT
jgi:CRP-like cAMP-binding protein